MKLVPHSNCVVCGGTKVQLVAPKEQIREEREFLDRFFRTKFAHDTPDYMFKDHIYFTHVYDAQLVACKTCGLVHRDPRLSPEDTYLEYQNDTYEKEWLDETYEPYCEAFLSEMPPLVKLLGPSPSVLEVGSQIGGFLYAANQYGWKAKGIDVGICMSEYSRSKGFDVFTGSLLDARLPANTYDAVFVWNCFEMIPDPWADLREISRILKSGGSLFISVPNGEFIKSIQPINRHSLTRPIRKHLWAMLAYAIQLGYSFQLGYTKKSITYLLEKSGFKNIRVSNQLYIPISSAKYLSKSALQQKQRYLKFTYYLSQLMHAGSFGRAIKNPWMLITCQKP